MRVFYAFNLLRREVVNGVETVTVEEDGVITSRKVNGQEQMERLEYKPRQSSAVSKRNQRSGRYK